MNKLCSCGFPQSFPTPHEHDRTERENQIIKHYEDVTKDLYEALKAVMSMGTIVKSYERDKALEALAQAEISFKASPNFYEACCSALVEIEDGSPHHAHLILSQAIARFEEEYK